MVLFRHLIQNRRATPRDISKKRGVEELWRDFFWNTSQWWDHRAEKINARFPDFKHKQTGESLWLAAAWNPAWVHAELAAIPPGTLQSNVFAWTQRLKRYVKTGQYVKAMEVYHQMLQKHICPDARTFLPVLKACACLGSLQEGKFIHSQITEAGYESDVYVATCLVDMYARCGSIDDAWSVFTKMGDHDVVTWSTMIGGYVKSGQGLKAMELFWRMQQEGVQPDTLAFVAVLNACASVSSLRDGMYVHGQVIQRGYESNVYVANCLVDMYAKCGNIEDAWNVFNKMQDHNIVSWNSIIGGYVKSGQGLKAMELFRKMQLEGVVPDEITFVAVSNACATVSALEEGRLVHGQIIGRGLETDVHVGNCIVDMYAKCGSIEDAWSAFNKMRGHDVVSWNVMIDGYVKSGHGLKVLELFTKMQLEGVMPDVVTFVGVLTACGSIGALVEGRHLHEQIIQRGCESDVYVANSLVDMYAKCGSIEAAQRMFNKMPIPGVVAWTTMIGGYAMHGHANKAIGLFKQMGKEDVEINEITFMCLLSACNHGGLVKEGLRYFETMSSCYDIIPTMEHCACILDLLSRAGWLEEADGMMRRRIPVERNVSVGCPVLVLAECMEIIEMAKTAAKRCW